MRPVTAIRYLFRGRRVRAWAGAAPGHAALIDGGDWHPYQPATFVTPPFPEFVSGHSTFSAGGGGAAALHRERRLRRPPATVAAGSSRIEPGRTPASDVRLRLGHLLHGRREAGLSRRYGGIHFEAGDLAGRALGRAVGAAVWARVRALRHGSP